MEVPQNGTVAGLRRILAHPDTAIQLLSYRDASGEHNTFDRLRTNVTYWLQAVSDRAESFRTHNNVDIGFMWGDQWTYESDDDGNEVIATRTSHDGSRVLRLRIFQPEVLAANWSASITPDRIEND